MDIFSRVQQPEKYTMDIFFRVQQPEKYTMDVFSRVQQPIWGLGKSFFLVFAVHDLLPVLLLKTS